MSGVWTIWRIQYLSATGGLQRDTRTRITWAIGLFVDIVTGFWTFHVLSDNLTQWQAAGQLTLLSHLWLLCLYTWAGMGFFTLLAVVSQGFSNDASSLLMSMPLSPAARLRAQYGVVLFFGLGNWIVLANLVTGISFVLRMHWQAILWLLMLDLGVATTVCISMLATWLAICFVLPNLKRTFIVLAITLVSLEALFLLFRVLNLTVHLMVSVSLLPVLPGVLCGLLLVMVMGPLAGAAGTLYENAFYRVEERSAARAVLMVPGIHILSAWMSRYRNLTGALLYKGLLNQSRNVFTWGRAAMLFICLALFPLLQGVLRPYDFAPVMLVAVYSSIVAILTIVEYAAYAISSEGARISYYVLAPLPIARYLHARLTVFLGPILVIGLAACLFLAWKVRLSLYETGMAATLMSLLLVGYTVLIVWSSASDLDINQVSEGTMQNLMLEELPVTPRRLQLLGGSLLLLVGMFLLILKLPFGLAIFAFVLLDGVMLVGLWRYSMICLRRLVGRTGY